MIYKKFYIYGDTKSCPIQRYQKYDDLILYPYLQQFSVIHIININFVFVKLCYLIFLLVVNMDKEFLDKFD